MAANLVFTNPELLTTILLELPMRDLLFAQRINRYFRDLITSTPALQRALFLRCEKPANPVAAVEDDPVQYHVNPLLYLAFSDWFEVNPVVCSTSENFVLTFFHLGLIEPPKPRTRYTCDGIFEEKFDPNAPRPWNRTKKGDAFLRKEASWRHMLVCQPPVQRLHVLKRSGGDIKDKVHKGILDFSLRDDGCGFMTAGVRMGVLYDLAPDPNQSKAEMALDWHMFDDQESLRESLPAYLTQHSRQVIVSRETSLSKSRSMFPNTFEHCVEHGFIENGPKYRHEMTVIKWEQLSYRGQTSAPLPSILSDAKEELNIEFANLTKSFGGFQFTDRADISALEEALGHDDDYYYGNSWYDTWDDSPSTLTSCLNSVTQQREDDAAASYWSLVEQGCI